LTIEDDFIRVGVVTGSHGLNGRLKIYIITDIAERFSLGNRVFVSKNGGGEFFIIKEFIPRKENTALLKLEGIDSVEQADARKGAELLITREAADQYKQKLGADEYLYSEVIGCAVSLGEENFGVVEDILQAGSGDILVIAGTDGRQYMIPFVTSMVDTARIAEGRITIHPVDGLFDI
jgi:16S rRNA processing protein RimM